MPLLAAYLGNLLFGIAAWFGTFLTKRIAILVAIIAMVTTLTAAFVVLIESAIAALSVSMPANLLIGASWVWPSNANACIAAIIAAYVARWVYEWNIKIIQYKLL
ncbi:MAG: DUF5455 family protein [Flavobacteriaceae bacterium]